jgi:3-hydroxymyristoyl/3-hydroxydecanoyl-(acyl carrier protein) dehydratase
MRLPAISGLRLCGHALTLQLDLPADLPQLDGHFPGVPILPAVAQVDWAARLARDHLDLPPCFQTLRSLKFLRIIQPPVRLELELKRSDDGRAVLFKYLHEHTVCSSGRIEFVHDAAGPDRSLL